MIEKGKKVTFHYTLKVQGNVVESSKDREPLEYTHGSQEIIPGLQKRMEGHETGEEFDVTVPPEEAYGPRDPQAVVDVPKSRLPEGDVGVGTVLSAKGQAGENLQAKVVEMGEETAKLDFNHPLAGEELEFQVQILEVS